MRWVKDIWGTIFTEFKIGQATLQASGLSDKRNLYLPDTDGDLLVDADQDGKLYGRKDGGWVEVTDGAGLIGAQGGQGFGVGICANESILVARGLGSLPGTKTRGHIQYGNYQHANGSIVCYVPKFFYRIGHASSPRYATYGVNAVDIVGIETFANEAEANASGYALHRAFVNAGIEINGFFYDKYIASKDGNTSCKSVFGVVPISLVADAAYTNSKDMVTPDGACAGIYADAVMLARARGAGWHCSSVFQQSAIGLLSLAHGQAATSTTYCAWYDPTGTTNFPKGCNNGALSDINDGTVTYTSAGDSGNASKPLCGANSNFAKTTHNGQECGIADINGSMWQVLLGITAPGASATDVTQAAAGAAYQSAYILKRSADISVLTHGWKSGAGGTEAWGDAAHLASLYDQLADAFPWTESNTSARMGSGSNQVFDSSVSGTGYLRTACGIPKDSGATNSAGTNLFGNDLCYMYSRANLFVQSAGNWNNSAGAGAFCRAWSLNRATASSYVGFRAAACG